MSPRHNKRQRQQYPCLWQQQNHNEQQQSSSIDDLLERFSTKPPPRSFFELWRPTCVVGQEFSISCLLLAGHRRLLEEGEDLLELFKGIWNRRGGTFVILLAFIIFLLVLLRSTRIQHQHLANKKNGTLTRLKDAFLLAGLLRLISSVLRTLTASYSSDTVHALAIGGMLIHLLACDFNYANGRGGKTSPSSSSFQGGTVSLNAALLSTTLLASRLSSNSTVYVFVTLSVVLFCFYPSARHAISQQASSTSSLATLVVTMVFLVIASALLQSDRERYLFGGTQVFLCFLAPLWNYSYLQHHKVLLTGPWDIAHIVVNE